jgi:Spy/CpxP family protein refolding chaperone
MMKRILVLAIVLLLIGSVQLYAQEAGSAPPSPIEQQLHPAETPEPYSEELAYLPPAESEMDMLLPEDEEMPPQGIEDAGMPRHFQGHDEAAVLPRILGKLKLTDAQKKDVDKILFDAAKQTIAQHAKVATARLELRQLFKVDSPDKNAIEKKINEIADLSSQIHINRVDGWFAVNKLLTPDQQKIWKHALADHSRMGHGKYAGHFSGEGRQHPQPFQHRHIPADGDIPDPPHQE